MVVVSGKWAKNISPYQPTPDINDIVCASESTIMSAKAILICHANSHPFQDRTVTLDQPVKVGRSVARAKAAHNNAVFDCKVLSRHHALLWYENGKFFLRDTKSSNGTFVNNMRLAPDIEHYEINSGDIVQFGVDVVENNRKVTHGCIIATLKLFSPDGKEVKSTFNEVTQLNELYKLHQVIQEATQRELCLESKLSALQGLVEETRLCADQSWQAFIGEERLLSRVAILEAQLAQAHQKLGEDGCREEMRKLQEENAAYQIAAKEALEKLHDERLEAIAAATEHERARITAQQEVVLARDQIIKAQQELEEIALKLGEERKKIQDLESQMKKNEEIQSEYNTRLSLYGLSSEEGDVQESKEKSVTFDPSMSFFRINLEENSGKKEETAWQKSIFDFNSTENCKNRNSESTEESNNNSSNSLNNSTDAIEDAFLEKLSQKEDESEDNKQDTNRQSKNGASNQNEEPERKNGVEPYDAESEEEPENAEEKDDVTVDCKTLKYHYQAVQTELKKKIEVLEGIIVANRCKINELERDLNNEKSINQQITDGNQALNRELSILGSRFMECENEKQTLTTKVESLLLRLEEREEKLTEKEKMLELKECESENKCQDEDEEDKSVSAGVGDGDSDIFEEKNDSCEKISPEDTDTDTNTNTISTLTRTRMITYEELVNTETELVLLKDRYSMVSEEKHRLQNEIKRLTEENVSLRNRSYNTLFWYVAPFVLMIFYLLVHSMVS